MNPKTDFTEDQPLKRFAFILRLREGAAEAYEKAHQEVWPEMCEMLKIGGISEYSIFRRDSLLLLTFKAVDFEATWSQFDDHPVNLRWQKVMEPFFCGTGGPAPRRTLPNDGGSFLSALKASDSPKSTSQYFQERLLT